MDIKKIGTILFWVAAVLVGLWVLAQISWLLVKLLVLAVIVAGIIYLVKRYLM
jgi:hypothetical protein